MSKKAQQLRGSQEKIQSDLREDAGGGQLRLARLQSLEHQAGQDVAPGAEPGLPPQAPAPAPARQTPAGEGRAATAAEAPAAPAARPRKAQSDADACLAAVCAYSAPGTGPHCNLSIAIDPELMERLMAFEDAVESTYRRRVTRTGIVSAAISTIDAGEQAASRAAPGTIQEKLIVRISAQERDRLRAIARSTRPRTPVTILVARALDDYLKHASKALGVDVSATAT